MQEEQEAEKNYQLNQKLYKEQVDECDLLIYHDSKELKLKFKTLTQNKQFSQIYSKGKITVGAYMVLYKLRVNKKCQYIYYGITVSKKIGNAVSRNRARRLIKESIRLNEHMFSSDYMYILVAKHRINNADFFDVQRNLRYLMSKSKS